MSMNIECPRIMIFFFQAEDGIRRFHVTGVQTCALPIFWNGRSQAVRLPKAFRFAGDEVLIRRQGERVILEPVTRRRWPKGYWERLRELTERFEFPDVEPLGGRLLDVRLDET